MRVYSRTPHLGLVETSHESYLRFTVLLKRSIQLTADVNSLVAKSVQGDRTTYCSRRAAACVRKAGRYSMYLTVRGYTRVVSLQRIALSRALLIRVKVLSHLPLPILSALSPSTALRSPPKVDRGKRPMPASFCLRCHGVVRRSLAGNAEDTPHVHGVVVEEWNPMPRYGNRAFELTGSIHPTVQNTTPEHLGQVRGGPPSAV